MGMTQKNHASVNQYSENNLNHHNSKEEMKMRKSMKKFVVMFLALMVPIRLLALIAKRENLHAIMTNVLAVIFVHLSAQSMRLVWEKLYLKKEEQASL